jgi:hypothetical protein
VALLDETARHRVSAAFQRDNTEASPFAKSQLRAAVDAADQWVEDNQTSFNQALPVAFRTSASTAQKVMLLGYVLWRRIGRLRTDEDG